MAEMRQVNEEYDRHIIRLTGWEWSGLTRKLKEI